MNDETTILTAKLGGREKESLIDLHREGLYCTPLVELADKRFSSELIGCHDVFSINRRFKLLIPCSPSSCFRFWKSFIKIHPSFYFGKAIKLWISPPLIDLSSKVVDLHWHILIVFDFVTLSRTSCIAKFLVYNSEEINNSQLSWISYCCSSEARINSNGTNSCVASVNDPIS